MTASITIETPSTPDYQAIKTKQRATWGAGDYGRIGITLQIVGESLCESMDVRAGQRVLDVAAGNGNATLAAARRFCDVTSTDYVASLLEQARVRTHAEGFAVEFREADAEALPFTDDAFDSVISTFGVMFTPDHATAASELQRVCRPGGTIGLANWTPNSFIGQLFETVARYLPPPAGTRSPADWGTRAFLDRHFGTRASRIDATPRQFTFRYQSPEHWLDVFSTYYGPTLKAFEALGEREGGHLQRDLLALIDAHNRADDGTMVVPSQYLEIAIAC